MTENPYGDGGHTRTSDTVTQGRATAVAQTAKQDAPEVAGTAKQGMSEVAQETKEQARVVTNVAKEHARGLFQEASSQFRSQADEQARRAAGGLDQLATQVRALIEGRPEEAGAIRDYAQDLGDRAQHVAEHMRSRGIDGVISDAGRFARRRPGLFLAGAAAAGFFAGRLVKAERSKADGNEGDGRSATATYGTPPADAAYPAGYDSNYPAAGYRSTPGGPPPIPDATTPPAADAIPSVGAGEQYGTSHASEPERW